ncbi:MAG: hypothetical protein ACPGU1_12145 [Myxococcota bacterium]
MSALVRCTVAAALVIGVSAPVGAALAAEKHDCTASGAVQPGPAPALSILEVDYGAFLYPRTLPLKASATDTDLLTVSCPSCDGSEAQVPVADDVHPGEAGRSGYRWVLTGGEGSLNGPYDVRPVLAAEAALDAARTTLEQHRRTSRDADELVEATQTVVNALEARRAKLSDRLDSAQERVTELSTALAELNRQARVTQTLLRGPKARLDVLRAEAAAALAKHLNVALSAPPSASEAFASFAAQDKAQTALDEQIDRLMARLSLLEGQLPRTANLARTSGIDAQLAQLTPQLVTRHAVTCKFATEVVPLLLTLKSADGGTRGLPETQSAVREFLTLCDATQVPEYEALVRALPATREICQHMAHGIPQPSPVQLEMLPMCGALYHEVQVITELRELYRRRDEALNAGGLESPRREMKAIRAKLRTLHEERAEVRGVWAKAQREHLDARMDSPMVSDEARAARDAADAEIAAVASAVASTQQRLRLLRDAVRRVEDQQVAAHTARRASEAELRTAEAELTGAWKKAQAATSAARLSVGEIATAEGRIKDAEKVLAGQLEALKANTKATGQLAWYSPPPLPLMLNSAPAEKRELAAARETRRKAAAALAQLEQELATAQADQLERLEGIASGVGAFKSLLVTQRQLEQRRRQLASEIQTHVQGAVEAAEAHREALRLARVQLDSLQAEEAFAALVPKYDALLTGRAGVLAAVSDAREAVDPRYDAYAEQLERQQVVRGEMVDKIVEMKISVATSLQFRAKVFESRRAIALQQTFDALLKALEVGRAVRSASEDDRGHREGLEAGIEAARAAIRKDEQAAEDTKALVAAQLSELKALTEKEARITTALTEARAAYHASRAAWAAAIAALDDHDAQIVATREAIASRWSTARGAALALWRMLGGDTVSEDGEFAYLLSAVLRDARLSIPEDLERFRVAVVAKTEAFSGHELVVSPDGFKTLDPLVTTARDRLHALEKAATDRRSVSEVLPGTRLATLHHERDRVVDALAANARARSASASGVDRDLKEAKRRRDTVMGSALTEARARASATEEQFLATRAAITQRLVSKLSVTLSLEATDRGAAAGRADDPPAATTVRLGFSQGLKPIVSAPAAPTQDARQSSRNKGTCEALTTFAAGKRHEWTAGPQLPKALYAGEAVGVFATTRDLDRVTPSCEAREPGCRRGPRAKALDIEEFHPVTWSVDNADGFTGGAGDFAGGQTTAAGIFVSPSSAELMEAGSPICEKPVVLSVTSLVDGDLAEESGPAPKRAKVIVKAGTIRASTTPISALPGQPVEVRFELFKLAEDGVPLASNTPFEEPLDGQRVTLTVERVSGPEVTTAWGFDGAKQTINTVSRKGVIKETITLAKAPGRYRVVANWRQGDACQSSVDIITPQHLASRLLYAPTHPAWMTAILDMAQRGQTTESELTQRVKALVLKTTSVDMNDDWSGADDLGVDTSGLTRDEYASTLQSWTIVSDRDHRPVSGETLRVVATGPGGLVAPVGQAPQGATPSLDLTSDGLGLVRAELGAAGVARSSFPGSGKPAGVRIERIEVDATRYLAGVMPVKETWAKDVALTQAWVGPDSPSAAPSERFRLDLARVALPGRAYSGVATLIAPVARGDEPLGEITLPGVHLNSVILDVDGIVRSGRVVFDAGKQADSGCTTLKGGGTVCVHHLTVRAGHDATWRGVVTLPLSTEGDTPTLVGPLHFAGTWTPGDGAVMTILDTLPALPLLKDGSARIERGARVTLDMSYRSSAPGLPATWRGLHLHRGRLALSRLRGVGAAGEGVVPTPVLRLGETVWSWPFIDGETVGGVDIDGLGMRLPGLNDATLLGATLDIQGGALTLQRADVAIRLPGTRDPIHGRLMSTVGAWQLDLASHGAVRLGEWATLRLRPGAIGQTDSTGMSRLQGELDVTFPGLSEVRMTGLNHDPKASELHVKSGSLEAPEAFADRFSLAVTGGALDTTAVDKLTDLPSAVLRISGDLGVASGQAAPGHVTMTADAAGIDLSATFKASPTFAGVSWQGDLTYAQGDWVGTLKVGESSRQGLDRIATPEMTVTMQRGEGDAAHLSLSGVGRVSAPKAQGDAAVAFFDTPYVAVDGALGVGWHHSASDADFIGYAAYRQASPLVTEGTLLLSDRGDGATLAATVDVAYAHGRDPVASVEGAWTYFDRPGVVTGRGSARVSASGAMAGRVALQLDIDTPGGELLHVVTPVDFKAKAGHVHLATGRFEGLMQEASIHVAGDVRVAVDASSSTAEAVLSGAMSSRGNWEWPLDDSLGIFQVDLVTRAELPINFAVEKGRGSFTLAPTETRWSGVVSGPLHLGSTNSVIASTTATGTGLACFPKLCLKAAMTMSTEHLGFAFTMDEGWLELGDCDRTCAR